MPLHLTPSVLEAAYLYLRATEPFRTWRLPEGEDVTFRITNSVHYLGTHRRSRLGHPIITVSMHRVGHTETLLCTIAHEICHLVQARDGTETKGTIHNAEFYKLAKRVCNRHGWDAKEFV